MKCEDFLPALASGNAWQRWRAHRHARRCAACAHSATMLSHLQTELSRVEPLSPAMRQAWEQAAGEPVVRASPIRRRVQYGLVAVAAATLIALGVQLMAPGPERKVTYDRPLENPAAPQQLAARTIDAGAELDELLARVDTLQGELDALKQQAELLDARRETNLLIATYSQW